MTETETPDTPETPEVTDTNVELDSAADSLATAFTVTPEEPPATTPAPDPSEEPGKLEPSSVWDDGSTQTTASTTPEDKGEVTTTFDPSSLSADDIKAVISFAQDTGEVPEGAQLFPDASEAQINNWDKMRESYKTLKQKLEEVEANPPRAEGGEDMAALRAEYEAIDRIRNSEAYAAEVNQPQIDALNQARQIGKDAFIDEETVDELFKAESLYQAETLLNDLQDPAAVNLLRPLVANALEARQKGVSAIQSKDPIKELEEWQARSLEHQRQHQQLLAQQEAQLDRAALDNAFQTRIANTPIGQTQIGQEKYQEIIADIEAGNQVDADTVYEGLWHQKMAPVTQQLITKYAQRINDLEMSLKQVGALPDNGQAVLTSPTNQPTRVSGGLPVDQLWNPGR